MVEHAARGLTFRPSCGTQLRAGSRFCTRCGTRMPDAVIGAVADATVRSTLRRRTVAIAKGAVVAVVAIVSRWGAPYG